MNFIGLQLFLLHSATYSYLNACMRGARKVLSLKKKVPDTRFLRIYFPPFAEAPLSQHRTFCLKLQETSYSIYDGALYQPHF